MICCDLNFFFLIFENSKEYFAILNKFPGGNQVHVCSKFRCERYIRLYVYMIEAYGLKRPGIGLIMKYSQHDPLK